MRIYHLLCCQGFETKNDKNRSLSNSPQKNYINVINGVVTCLLSADGKHLAELVVERGHLARLDLGRQSPGNQVQHEYSMFKK